MADEEMAKIVKRLGESKASDLTSLAWSEPKKRHKKVMNHTIIRYPVLLIFCLRAERKIKFVKVDGKTKIVDAGFMPICEKGFMFEMLVSCMMEGVPEGKPGVPIHIKQLEPDLEPVFKSGEQVNEKTGERLAAWAKTHKEELKDEQQDDPLDPLRADITRWLLEIEGTDTKAQEKHLLLTGGKYKTPYDMKKESNVMTIHGKVKAEYEMRGKDERK